MLALPTSGFRTEGGSVAGLACSKSMDGWEAEGGGTAGTPGPRFLVPGQLYPVACQETGYRQRGCQQHEVKEHGAFPPHESLGGMPQHSPQPTLAGWSAVNSTTPSRPGKTVNCGSEESSEISKKKVPPRGTASVSYSWAVR